MAQSASVRACFGRTAALVEAEALEVEVVAAARYTEVVAVGVWHIGAVAVEAQYTELAAEVGRAAAGVRTPDLGKAAGQVVGGDDAAHGAGVDAVVVVVASASALADLLR